MSSLRLLQNLTRVKPNSLQLNIDKNRILEKKITKRTKYAFKITKKPKNKSKSPSPTLNQNSFVFIRSAFLERISLFISRKRKYWGRMVKAGMTVEASILLPIFLFAMLSLSSAIEMIRLHSNLQTALWNTGRKLQLYGSFLSDPEDGAVIEEAKDLSVSYLYVKRDICSFLGEEYLENSPLTYGIKGLQFAESEIFTDDDHMELNLTYKVSSGSVLIQTPSFWMANRYYGHMWNGYDLQTGKDSIISYVYVTEYGEVYHKDRNCTHIALTIREVPSSQVFFERNQYGGIYSECEKCRKNAHPGNLYIAAEGDRYHYDRDCPGLKRSIYVIPESEASKYRPCSRCVGVH